MHFLILASKYAVLFQDLNLVKIEKGFSTNAKSLFKQPAAIAQLQHDTHLDCDISTSASNWRT